MLLTDADYAARIATIKTIRLAIPTDPLSVGLPALTTKIAEIQTHRDLVNSLLIEAMENRAKARLTFESNKTELDMQLDALLANDNEVKGQKSAELRSSMASTKAADLELKKHQAEIAFIRADSYCSIVQQVYQAVNSASDSLMSQISLLQLGVDAGVIPLNNLGVK